MHLAGLTDPKLVFADPPCMDRSSLLRALSQRIAENSVLGDPEDLYQRLLEREQLGSTGIGGGVAVPHCKMPGIDEVVVAVALLSEGIEFEAVDQEPVRLFFLVVSPENQPDAHLQCLAAISKWLKADRHIERILEIDDPAAIYPMLQEEI